MDYVKYKAHAPGSLMLFGEHAVLRGKLAIVCAVNKRIYVTLTPRKDKTININSDALGPYTTHLNEFTIVPPFDFVLSAIADARPHLMHGFDLTIHSDFSHQVGLGSSAAVTAATLNVLYQFVERPLSKQALFQKTRELIQSIQGKGSGADVAASIFGGIIAYRMDPLSIEKISAKPPISLVYSGFKTSTVEVIHKVQAEHEKNPELFDRLFEKMEICSKEAVLAIQRKDWEVLGDLMNRHQQIQHALGVSPPIMEDIIHCMREQDNIIGAKISGSGLGDCVIGLGELPHKLFPRDLKEAEQNIEQLNVAISLEGIEHE